MISDCICTYKIQTIPFLGPCFSCSHRHTQTQTHSLSLSFTPPFLRWNKVPLHETNRQLHICHFVPNLSFLFIFMVMRPKGKQLKFDSHLFASKIAEVSCNLLILHETLSFVSNCIISSGDLSEDFRILLNIFVVLLHGNYCIQSY